MNLDKVRWYISFIVPILGVAFLGWNTFSILLFFCFESFLSGLFFVMKGLIGVYHTRKLKGFIFLILFCGLYFVHLIILTVVIGNVGDYFNVIVLPSFVSIGVSIIILLIPNIIEQINFSKAMQTTNPTVQDLGPIVDLLFDFKETMLRVFVLWSTLPFVFGSILADTYWHFPLMVSELIVIIIFTTIRFLSDSYSLRQRKIAFNASGISNARS